MNQITIFQERLADKKLVAQWNSSRYDRAIKLAVERRYLERKLQTDENLRACDPDTVTLAFLDLAASGLSLSPSLGHAYMVPYGKTCVFTPGYKGICHLFYQGGTILSIQPGLHKEGDPRYRKWTENGVTQLFHEESAAPDRSKRDTLHAYVIAKLASGERITIDMDREALLKVEFVATHKRGKDDAGKSIWVPNPKGGMVWRGDFRSQMEIKAVIRRASNYWPRDAGGKVEHAIQLMDKHDGFEPETQPTDDPAGELLVSDEQRLELHAALTDLGIESERATSWLVKKATAMGYGSMDQLPARLVDEVKAALVERAKQFLERQQQPPVE
jgi:recombinational DNA repair protein RecT